MNIGIIGAGNVGGTLGSRWAQKGHQVLFGVNDPKDNKVKALLLSAGSNARPASVNEVATMSDVVVLAIPWNAMQDVIQRAGNLEGKILIDATNPIEMSPEGLSKGLVLGHTTSAAELVATWAKGARVVKAFNTTGWQNMANPNYGLDKVTMFLCGGDAEAKSVVAKLGEDLGFEMIDAGPITTARLLEPYAMLWIHLAYLQGLGPNFVFKVLKR
jgi:predicted dinucleotide-binding enzyme